MGGRDTFAHKKAERSKQSIAPFWCGSRRLGEECGEGVSLRRGYLGWEWRFLVLDMGLNQIFGLFGVIGGL